MNETAAALNPWQGLDAYTEQDQCRFFGRTTEAAELTRMIGRAPLTLLLGRSGMGKTSLLRAAVSPLLRKEKYLPVWVRIMYSPNAAPPSLQIRNALEHAAQERNGSVEMAAFAWLVRV